MRLQRLYLTNFRQFRSGSITFATENDRNVTVIHGQNGSGKTTLLNALTWVLYGDVDFELRPEKLANQGALVEADSGSTVRVEVTLEFEDENIEYELTRWLEYQKQSEKDYEGEIVDEDLSLSFILSDGTRGTRSNPQDSIEQILPERLSDLFFFHGEYIEKLSTKRSEGEIRNAIQNIMGLKIIERSINHLEAVEDRFEDELEQYANSELKSLIERRSELKDRKDDHTQALESAKESQDTLKSEIEKITRTLKHMDDSSELEENRAALEEDLLGVEEQIDQVNQEIEETISKKGNLPFAMPAVEETAKDLDDLREKGVIPSEVSNEFVNGLLEGGECICGRPLEPGTEASETITAYKSDAVVEGFDQAAIRIISHLTQVDDERDEYFDTISKLLEQRSALRDMEQSLAEEISEISSQLGELDQVDPKTGETPAELETARDEKQAQLESARKDITRHELSVEEIDADLEGINEEIDDARQEQEEAQLARKRMRATEKVRRQLEGSFDNLQSRVRNWSNTLVAETFDKIATKEYEAEITDEFELRIKDQLADEYLDVDKSRGERQIASLTFIGSLVQIARERYESEEEPQFFSGGIYPIIMDSPFGALDDEHRRQVSDIIPKMAEQVVVMVTDSQWRGPVANELSDIAGREYHLEFNSGNSEGSYPHTTIKEVSASQEVR